MTDTPLEIHFDHLDRTVPIAGLTVADIGCGKGELVRRLRQAGADVSGVECGEGQIAAARAADPDHAADYLNGSGEAMPLDDSTFDLVVFSYSLHHVPVAVMGKALGEAHRVLKPHGRLYVLEPMAAGEMYALDGLIDDEAAVRQSAQEALEACAGFRETGRVTYDTHYAYASVDDLVGEMTSIDAVRKERAAENDAALRSIFETTGTAVPGGRRFAQPNLALLFARV